MLKKLRFKFIFINMLIVSIMLSIISSTIFFTVKVGLEKESIRTLKQLVGNPATLMRPNMSQREVGLPYFSLFVDDYGDVIETGGGFFDLSDEDVIAELLDKVEASETGQGTINEYNLRFISKDVGIGTNIVFSDMTSEKATLRSLFRAVAFVDSAAFIVFLGISIVLAYWAVKPVETAWKQQKQFVADASHELKTPLTVIMTNAEMIADSECKDEEKAQLSANILTMSHQMRGLVESLLELARIDNGTVKEQKTLTSFSDIALDSAMIFEPLFFEKGMSFEYDVESGIEFTANAQHLKQLVDILLDNATKYTKEGGAVNLSLKKTGSKKCRLEVSDEGEAISAEDLKNLFKRFYRADKARAMNHSYGLGLSIAQSIATEHKGKIWAESIGGINKFIVEIVM